MDGLLWLLAFVALFIVGGLVEKALDQYHKRQIKKLGGS